MAFLSVAPVPVHTLSFLPVSLPPSQIRLAGFIALSIALHVLTAFGVGPLDFSARRFGDGPQRVELHATLAPGAQPQGATAPSQLPGETETTQALLPDLAAESAPQPGASAERAGAALPAPEIWYTAREVDVRAEPLTDIRLRYPEDLRGEPVVGRVQLRVFIDERGVVRRLEIAASRPAGMFDAAARKAWEEVRFSPAIRNGVPVKSQKLLELTYEPGLM